MVHPNPNPNPIVTQVFPRSYVYESETGIQVRPLFGDLVWAMRASIDASASASVKVHFGRYQPGATRETIATFGGSPRLWRRPSSEMVSPDGTPTPCSLKLLRRISSSMIVGSPRDHATADC